MGQARAGGRSPLSSWPHGVERNEEGLQGASDGLRGSEEAIAERAACAKGLGPGGAQWREPGRAGTGRPESGAGRSCRLWRGLERGAVGPAGSFCSRLGALEAPSPVPGSFWKNRFLCGQSGQDRGRGARGQAATVQVLRAVWSQGLLDLAGWFTCTLEGLPPSLSLWVPGAEAQACKPTPPRGHPCPRSGGLWGTVSQGAVRVTSLSQEWPQGPSHLCGGHFPLFSCLPAGWWGQGLSLMQCLGPAPRTGPFRTDGPASRPTRADHDCKASFRRCPERSGVKSRQPGFRPGSAPA